LGKYDLFRKITKSTSSETNNILNTMKADILREFKSSPSYRIIKINGSDREVHWVDENAINKNPDKKRILSRPDEHINVGDMVIDNNNYWLCTNTDTTAINTNGLIEKCNKLLKWIDEDEYYDEIQEEWCILYDKTRTGANTNDGRYMVLGTSEFAVIIQNNINTKKIKRNMRFIFNDGAHSVSGVDFETIPGLIILAFKEDQINNSKDDISDDIADKNKNQKDENSLW